MVQDYLAVNIISLDSRCKSGPSVNNIYTLTVHKSSRSGDLPVLRVSWERSRLGGSFSLITFLICPRFFIQVGTFDLIEPVYESSSSRLYLLTMADSSWLDIILSSCDFTSDSLTVLGCNVISTLPGAGISSPLFLLNLFVLIFF